MIPVITKEQAYKLDEDTIKSGHLSQEELMDNAGKAVAQFFCEKIPAAPIIFMQSVFNRDYRITFYEIS